MGRQFCFTYVFALHDTDKGSSQSSRRKIALISFTQSTNSLGFFFFLVATNVTISLILNAKYIDISFVISKSYYLWNSIIYHFSFISLENKYIALCEGNPIIENRNGFLSLDLSSNSFQLRERWIHSSKESKAVRDCWERYSILELFLHGKPCFLQFAAELLLLQWIRVDSRIRPWKWVLMITKAIGCRQGTVVTLNSSPRWFSSLPSHRNLTITTV